MSTTTSKDLIEWLRAAAPYIHMHKNKTFILVFDESLLASPNFMGFIHDLNVLASIGIKIVLVHGSQTEIEKTLKKKKITPRFVNQHQIIDKETLSVAQELSGRLRLELEGKLSTALPNSPMAGSNIRVSSGNFIFATPLGVIDGIDTLYAGETRKVDETAIIDRLEKQEIVLLSSMGFSPTGEIFVLTKEDVATEAAIALKADKLIFLSELPNIRNKQNQPIRELYTNKAKTILKDGTLCYKNRLTLRSAIKACDSGVERVHVVDVKYDGGLITELFTHKGIGILITKNPIESVRKAIESDADSIFELIKPLQENQILVPRTEKDLAKVIEEFIVLEHDSVIVGCAALHPFHSDKIGELACLVVHPVYRNTGAGKILLKTIEKLGREKNLSEIFVLTTKSTHWFIQNGFINQPITKLPIRRQKVYNSARNSKTLSKKI